MRQLKSFVSIILIRISAGLFTVQPKWVTSPYIKAGSYDVIATLTGNS
jgi:hypothetical protein